MPSSIESEPNFGKLIESKAGFKQYEIELQSDTITIYPENNRMNCFVFIPQRHAEKMPVVVAVHYWGATDLEIEKSIAGRLAANGIATIAIELPYHLSRTPAGKRSGELAVQPDIRRLKQMMRQSKGDISTLIDWICARSEFDSSRIGLMGSSLGGIVGALAFATDPRISSYVSLLGGVDLTELIWSSSRMVRQREVLRRQGITKEKLREELADIEPMTYLKKDDPRPAYVIGAKFDTVVPKRSYDALINSLGNVEVLWLATGHYGGFIVQSSVMRTIAQFFTGSFEGTKFIAPGRLYAPTIRLVGISNVGTALRVGIGLDVWRNTANGDFFGSLIFTPSGIQGFLGVRASTGLTLGFSILPRRTSVGAMWSFVL